VLKVDSKDKIIELQNKIIELQQEKINTLTDCRNVDMDKAKDEEVTIDISEDVQKIIRELESSYGILTAVYLPAYKKNIVILEDVLGENHIFHTPDLDYLKTMIKDKLCIK
jgi:glycosylphosphatidylinositol transamidase (GPIT) subunit GPI8